MVPGRSDVLSFLKYLYSPSLACINYRSSRSSFDYPNSMPKKTTLKTRRCWHKESFFCSLLLREQHLCHAAQQRAPVSTHLVRLSPRDRRPLLSTRTETLTENTATAHPSLV